MAVAVANISIEFLSNFLAHLQQRIIRVSSVRPDEFFFQQPFWEFESLKFANNGQQQRPQQPRFEFADVKF